MWAIMWITRLLTKGELERVILRIKPVRIYIQNVIRSTKSVLLHLDPLHETVNARA